MGEHCEAMNPADLLPLGAFGAQGDEGRGFELTDEPHVFLSEGQS